MAGDNLNTFETICLSLESSVARKKSMLDIFSRINIPPKFFTASTPEDLTQDDRDFFSSCDFYDWDINQEAVMATFKSHLRILNYAVDKNQNLLVLEDDIDYVKSIDFNSIDFSTFDLFILGTERSCYSYFISAEGASKALAELNSKTITQAFDWELSKLSTVNKVIADQAYFIQHHKLPSAIAPNGYIRK